MKYKELFEPEPEQWGLRGDPYLWAEMKEYFSDKETPDFREQVQKELFDYCNKRCGKKLSSGGSVFIKEYAHGGMSSGQVDLDWWYETGIPLLVSRKRQWTDFFDETEAIEFTKRFGGTLFIMYSDGRPAYETDADKNTGKTKCFLIEIEDLEDIIKISLKDNVNHILELKDVDSRNNIKDFMKNHPEFDSHRKRRKSWKGYAVYHVWAKADKDSCVGYPQFALDDGETIRLAELDEIHELMKFYL